MMSENYSTYRFTLDIHHTKSQVSIPVLFQDTWIQFLINLTDGGKPYTLDEVAKATLFGKKADGTSLVEDCDIIDNTRIEYTFSEQTASALGPVECEIRLYSKSGRQLTSPSFTIVVEERVLKDEDIIESETEKSAIDRILDSEEAIKAAAAKAEEEANRAEEAAKTATEGGATFTPDVSAEGVLSWTNDKGLENPDAVNIRGPKGERGQKGEGFSISKTYPSVAAMEADFANSAVPLYGFVLIDTGNVEDEDNAKLYVKQEGGFSYLTDLSGAQGIKGEQGAPGDTGEKGDPGEQGQVGPPGSDGFSPTVSVSKSGKVTTISITDGNGTKTATVYDGADGAKGDKGDKGDTGAQGQQGIQGIQGPKGDKGDKGDTGATGATGKDGKDYVLTDADKAEIADAIGENYKGAIAQLVIAELQGLPVFGVVDANNIITVTSQLSGGTYTLKYENADGTTTDIGTITVGSGGADEPTVRYTNQIPLSTNADGSEYVGTNGEDGYKVGYRVNSSGVEAAQTGMCVTGYIPYTDNTMRLKNVTVSGTKDAYIAVYNLDRSFLQVRALADVLKDDGSGVYIGSLAHNGYIRITCGVIDDTSILTFDEEIV